MGKVYFRLEDLSILFEKGHQPWHYFHMLPMKASLLLFQPNHLLNIPVYYIARKPAQKRPDYSLVDQYKVLVLGLGYANRLWIRRRNHPKQTSQH
jgi:hypothetical protein